MKTKSVQHSPTPWKESENGDLVDANGEDCASGNEEANKAFLLKACNAHEALVQAIKDVLGTARECDLCSGSGKASPEFPPDEACHQCGGTGKILLAEGEIGTMEAALKLAGEVKS